MDTYLSGLVAIMREHSCPEIAEKQSAYMRNLYPFLGIKTPLRRQLQKEYFKAFGKPKVEKFRSYILELWRLSEREFQYLALSIFETNLKNIEVEDIKLIEALISTKSWWDSVDGIIKINKAYFVKFPELAKPITEKWITSDNFWFQRSAILFQLHFKEATNPTLLFDYCKRRANSSEFFVRKAIGWALRAYSRVDAEAVKEFVANNKLSALSKREALRLL